MKTKEEIIDTFDTKIRAIQTDPSIPSHEMRVAMAGVAINTTIADVLIDIRDVLVTLNTTIREARG